jgi:serine/threonine-protein kinase
MAPEQFAGERGLDARVDVWAMGVVLFEMISGRAPHQATAIFELMNQIQNQPAPPLGQVRPGCPDDVAQVVARALEADRERRFPSVGSFMSGLLACAAAEPLATLPFAAFNAARVDYTVAGRSIPDVSAGESDPWDDAGDSSIMEESVTSVPALLIAQAAQAKTDPLRRVPVAALAGAAAPAEPVERTPPPVAPAGAQPVALRESSQRRTAGREESVRDTGRRASPDRLESAVRTSKRSRAPVPGWQLWPHGVVAMMLSLIVVLLVLLVTRR